MPINNHPVLDSDMVEILKEFLPSIRRMASGLASRNPSALDVEDLMSAGMIGLLSALTRFDPSRDIKFRTYAEYRIRGMMLDEIRSMDWVPRSVRSRRDQIRQASTLFTRKEGRQPDRHELAELLGMTQKELEAASPQDSRFVSLDDPVGGEEESFTLKDLLPDPDHVDPFAQCLHSETHQALGEALEKLSTRQREVVQLYYFAGMTMKEIGLHLGLTESGVCRIHSEAIRRLRKGMEPVIHEMEGMEGFPSLPLVR